ncbi:hypothetical protein CKAH01_07378 [Colletotrichum kahawae]|uniref:Uncharacterized protein n=1 Tax=Colletotrichum kahawae TaxID=34407 RepID=A0AAD9Y483_COLKA|nr:hypothetical protein CKAH01_07378 [Colletotrichum kahawae]
MRQSTCREAVSEEQQNETCLDVQYSRLFCRPWPINSPSKTDQDGGLAAPSGDSSCRSWLLFSALGLVLSSLLVDELEPGNRAEQASLGCAAKKLGTTTVAGSKTVCDRDLCCPCNAHMRWPRAISTGSPIIVTDDIGADSRWVENAGSDQGDNLRNDKGGARKPRAQRRT